MDVGQANQGQVSSVSAKSEVMMRPSNQWHDPVALPSYVF